MKYKSNHRLKHWESIIWVFGLYLEVCSLGSLVSLVAQTVKNLPAMQETQVRSLGWENPLEKGLATHSCILAWRIPRTEKPGGLQSMGSQRVRCDWATNTNATEETKGKEIKIKEMEHQLHSQLYPTNISMEYKVVVITLAFSQFISVCTPLSFYK